MRNIFKKHIILFKALILSAFILIGTQFTAQAQVQDNAYNRPSVFLGAAVGANFNFYQGSTQDINADLFSYPAFHNGKGVGLYLAPLFEFHKPNSAFGVMLQVGYDNRQGKFEQVTTPCDCPADLKTNLSYITIEPSLRVQPFKGNFYVYAGPRFAQNLDKSFKYDKGASADGNMKADPELKGDFSNMHKTVISMQIGAGYDIPISSQDKATQYVLSPFVAIHPYFGQNPRSIETWNVTTLRAGIALKFGKGRLIKHAEPVPAVVVIVEPEPVAVVVVTPEPVAVVVVPVEIVRTYTLYYKFDKSNLDNTTISNLDKIIKDLKANKTIGVTIKSYADVRGTDAYNMALSKRRGSAVVGYLISHGITVEYIGSKGLGETTIFNKDKKVNESNYALNRNSTIILEDITQK